MAEMKIWDQGIDAALTYLNHKGEGWKQTGDRHEGRSIMDENAYLMSLLLVFATLLLVGWHLSSKREHRAMDDFWPKLNATGIPVAGPFKWPRALAASITSTRRFASEGYAKFASLGQPFALPTTWTGKAVVVLPPSLIQSILVRPDKLSQNTIHNIPGLIETIQLPFIVSDSDIYTNPLHFDVVRKKLLEKDMHLLAPSMDEEIQLAFCDIWGSASEWTTINGWDACGRIVARAAERMMFGLPLGRDKQMLEASRMYANSLLFTGAIINCFPPVLRGVIGPLLSLRTKYYQARCIKLLRPVIEERLRLWHEEYQSDKCPDDFLQWLIDACAAAGPHQLNSTRIAYRVIALMTPLIFAVCYVFAHAVLDLYGSQDKEEFLSGLEAECSRVSLQHGGLSTLKSVDALHHVDFTIRESMRVSDVAVVNIYRDVLSGELDIGNNIIIPRGIRTAFPTQMIHLDPDNYKDARRFDAFRFSRDFDQIDLTNCPGSQSKRQVITTVTPTFLPLGYGRHACPGRWFAALIMKQALAHLILNYDVQVLGRSDARTSLLNAMLPPTNAKIRIRHKSPDARVRSQI